MSLNKAFAVVDEVGTHVKKTIPYLVLKFQKSMTPLFKKQWLCNNQKISTEISENGSNLLHIGLTLNPQHLASRE